MADSQRSSPFVSTIDLALADKLLKDLKSQGFEITIPAYTRFSAKKKGVTCTLYESGKLVTQGKDSPSFIEFYLEPEILGSFQFTHPAAAAIDFIPHIGIDESGKGDFFGPLCIAGVYATNENVERLKQIGARDSKSLSDVNIHKIADKIKETCVYHLVKINPTKYNEIYRDFKNLNRLLAWGHATTIEQLVTRTGCQEVLIDQFADESVVQLALKRKKLTVQLSQRHRAEEDIVVAAASILARQTFLEGLDKLGQTLGIALPKGASAATIEVGKKIVSKWGVEGLRAVCKEHFKTLDVILGKPRE